MRDARLSRDVVGAADAIPHDVGDDRRAVSGMTTTCMPLSSQNSLARRCGVAWSEPKGIATTAIAVASSKICRRPRRT